MSSRVLCRSFNCLCDFCRCGLWADMCWQVRACLHLVWLWSSPWTTGIIEDDTRREEDWMEDRVAKRMTGARENMLLKKKKKTWVYVEVIQVERGNRKKGGSKPCHFYLMVLDWGGKKWVRETGGAVCQIEIMTYSKCREDYTSWLWQVMDTAIKSSIQKRFCKACQN